MTGSGPLRLGVAGADGFATFITAALRDLALGRGRGRRLPHRAEFTVDLGGEPAKQHVYAESV